MNFLSSLPITHHSHLLSTPDAESHAWSALREFYHFSKENDAYDHLWFMLVKCMESPDEAISARDRSDMIFFYEHCLALFKAVEVLHCNRDIDMDH